MCGGVIGEVFKGVTETLGLTKKPPSAAEIAAQEQAAAQRAQAEVDRVKTEADREKAAVDAKNVASLADAANKDLLRRQANRTLLNGVQDEELDPQAASFKKAKRATLLQRLS